MKKLIALVLVVMMALGAAACGKAEPAAPAAETKTETKTEAAKTIENKVSDAKPETSNVSAEEPLFSEERTLRCAITSEPASMDPHQTVDTWSAIIFQNVYDGLLEVSDDGKIVPRIAEGYTIVDDVTVDFALKKGIKFTNGEEMKASDVVFTFNRAMVAPILINTTDMIDSVEALDDYTVRFHLKNPSAAFIANMCHSSLGILSEKAVNEFGDDYYKNPVGTGPYKVDKWDMGVEIQLSYNEDYWGEVPDFTTIIIRTIPEATSRAIELEAGSVDFITDVATTDFSRLQDDPGLDLVTTVGTSVRFLGMNCSVAPLDDVRVRQAIAYAVDCEGVNVAINRGYGTVATSAITPAIMFCSEVGRNETNIEKAKALLAEAGYPNGLDITLSTDTRKEYSDVVVILQQQLAEAGIRVTLDNTEWAVFLDKCYSGDTQLFMLGFGCTTPDPDVVFYQCFHSANAGPKGAMAFLADDEVDALIDAERVELDVEKRTQMYEELQAKLAELKPWVYLYNTVVAAGINTNKISAIKIDGADIQRFIKVYR